jgi:serine protease Do
VLRLGRIQNVTDRFIQTDCTLVGGDSGGPLFDLDGKVIGIHSRIGPAIAFNIHVPVDTYTTNWDDLVAGKEWGNMFGFGPPKRTSPPSLGLSFEKSGDLMKITDVEKDSAADKVGFKVKDLIEKLDGKTVSSYDDIVDVLKKKKEGEEVTVDFLRAGSPMTLKLKLGKAKS